MAKYYIAFSIHGSKTFIVATKEIDAQPSFSTVYDKGARFTISASRRFDPNPSDGQKLLWEKLLTKEGHPLVSAPAVLNRFKQLEAMGWTIVPETKKAFISKHWSKC